MRFHEPDPWQTWQQRLERERSRELSLDTFPLTLALPTLDPSPITFGQWPPPRPIHFPPQSAPLE